MELSERIRLGFDRFNERDWGALERGLAAEFEAVDHVPPDERRAYGPNAMREITEANGDTAFADLRMEVIEIAIVPGADDSALAVVRVAAKGSGGTSGVPVDAEIGQVWTFTRGVATRFEQFRTWKDAQQAAGCD